MALPTTALVIAVALAAWWYASIPLHKLPQSPRVIVCGASTGIGQHIAFTYARMNASVCMSRESYNKRDCILS